VVATLAGQAFICGWTNSVGTVVTNGMPFAVADNAATLYARWTLQTYTTGTPVNVPYDWLDQWGGNSGNYEALAKSKGLNGYFYWESYVAGLIPTDATSKFRITDFKVRRDNGKDAVATLDWTPHRTDRKYTVWGKTNLTDSAWHSPTNDATRFFKVSVDLGGN